MGMAMKGMKAMKMKAMKKAMKGMKAMKAMRKSMKKKRVSIIAKGKYARSVVFRGTKQRTAGGLSKDQLHRNKQGRIVSKKATANGKKQFKNIKAWTDAVKAARKQMG